MLTPQEVAEHGFSKSRMGGYNMKEVDDFLDELTADFSELYKENSVLKGKIKVLAEKISEYRETEDAMRTTLLTAQKMANSMVVQAEEEKKRMIAEAERAALQRKAEVEQEVADAEYQLKMAKNATAQFVEHMRDLMKQEASFLDQLPAIKAEPVHPKKAEPIPAPAAPEAEVAGDETAEAQKDDCINQILQEEAGTEQEPAAAAVGAAEADMEDTEGHRIDFNNLQFGKDYEIK